MPNKKTYGTGTIIAILFNSKSSFCNSYSMLTSHPFLVSDGQQLTLEDKKLN